MKISFYNDKALHCACSDDKSREILHYVNVSQEGDSYIAAATDGKMLVTQNVDIFLDDGDQFKPVNIHKNIWEAAYKNGKYGCTIIVEGKNATTLTKKGNLSMPLSESIFPNWRQAKLPKDWIPDGTWGFNGESISKFCKAVRKHEFLMEIAYDGGPMRLGEDVLMPHYGQTFDVVQYLKHANPSERESALNYLIELKAMMEPKNEINTNRK